MPHSASAAAEVSAPMNTIVRLAIVVSTIALFVGSTFNAIAGQRDIAILFALATPLGISAWGFARSGHNEAALVLLSGVLATVVTLVLILNPLGVRNLAVIAYGGIILVGALVLSRHSFFALTGLTLVAGTFAFIFDITGHTRSLISHYSHWSDLAEFLLITGVFAGIGRMATETLFGSLGAAHRATVGDPVTGLANRARFLSQAQARLKPETGAAGYGALVLADLDAFRRVNVVIGYQAADEILRQAAQRLVALGAQNLVGRVGDDEFAILAVGLGGESEADTLARAVLAALTFDHAGVAVRSAVGYARFPRDADTLETLLLAADSALVRAKAQESARFAAPGNVI